MSKDTEEDFSRKSVGIMSINILSNKMKILIVGGGKAGLLKTNSFVKRGCDVTVVSPDFCEGFFELINLDNLTLIKRCYLESDISDKHLIVISINDLKILEKIVDDCVSNYKLFLNCTNFTDGNFIVPMQVETKGLYLSMSTKTGNPKAISMILDAIKDNVKGYDSFIEFSSIIRNRLKNNENKNQIMEFICSKDFYYFYQKDKHEKILAIFYGGKDFEYENSNT